MSRGTLSYLNIYIINIFKYIYVQVFCEAVFFSLYVIQSYKFVTLFISSILIRCPKPIVKCNSRRARKCMARFSAREVEEISHVLQIRRHHYFRKKRVFKDVCSTAKMVPGCKIRNDVLVNKHRKCVQLEFAYIGDPVTRRITANRKCE